MNFAKEILKKQLVQLSKDCDSGFSVGLVDENDFFKWQVIFTGTEGTLYEGGFFKAILNFPKDFPQSPPEMKFITEMWHPNIYEDGKVCISILHSSGYDPMNEHEKPEERWRPILGVEQILISVISMLNDPNENSPANVDAAVQMRKDPEAYKKKVKKLVLKSMDDL